MSPERPETREETHGEGATDDGAHPSAFVLDAIAAGGREGGAHLQACAECAGYVAKLREGARAFRAEADPAAFAEVIRLRAASEGAPRSIARRSSKVAWIAGPVLAAAAIVLWLRLGDDAAPMETTPPAPHATATPSGESARFKGGPAVTAIRDRAGRQERLTGPFTVAPGDRIRVEVALDRDTAVVAGLLASNGTWIPLLAPTTLGPGTHYSDLAARFDDTPTDALLLVGAPADVARARASRNVEGVVAWRVRSEPSE